MIVAFLFRIFLKKGRLVLQPFYIKDVLQATGGTLICGDENALISSVSTDSRTLSEGALFIPIKGERFDGHDFTDKSDMYISQNTEAIKEGKTIINVSDTIEAFGAIAKLYKQKYNVPTISVVGSVGKTTTRDFTASVLSRKYNTLKTDKNFNNNIGVPIMIFRMEQEHEAAVLELGMSALGEISYLADIVKPDTVIMTNIGMSHIENLGSQDNIFKAKMESLENFAGDNTVIANADDKYLCTVESYGDYKVLFYGVENNRADVRAVNIKDKGLDGTEFDILYNTTPYHVRLSTPGVHNVYNALAAFCAGIVHKVEPEEAVIGLENAQFTAMRMELTEKYGIKIINDCYNAAPSSAKAALEVLSKEVDTRRVAVLGDMLEMGAYAKDAHTRLGKIAAQKADVLVCVGTSAAHIAAGADEMKHIYTFKTTEQAVEMINTIVAPGDTVLLKASRGMHFEKLFQKITEG